MNQFAPKPVREFLKDVKRASTKDKKSLIMSMKKAQDIAEALEDTFASHQMSQSSKMNSMHDTLCSTP
ncbi:MAG: hypothetical protein NPIRA04_24330 [Nitrospirales bacterium]|nr:MAG: hypothetical protein NPIRA04_24330 [Nitrospirales bacterium]